MAFSFARSPRSANPLAFSIALPYGRTAARRPARGARPRAAEVPAAPAGADRKLLGVAAILAGTIAFPLSDLAAKSLITSLPPIEIAWLRYLVFLLAALPLLARGRRAVASARPGLQVLRGTMSALSTLAATVAFKFLPVAETTAISFVAPVIVTALAVVFLGEAVGLRRWAAAIAALIGVLIIVQPGGASFCPAALIPLGGAVASAVAVITTRLNKTDSAGATILYSTVVGTAILTGLVIFDWKTPNLAELEVGAVVGIFGALGSLMQVLAYRWAPASLLAPFSYMQLIFAGALSYLILGSVPGAGMIAGSTIIAASAIYTANRERVKGVA